MLGVASTVYVALLLWLPRTVTVTFWAPALRLGTVATMLVGVQLVVVAVVPPMVT
jgi:hypothetical protein